MKPTALLTVPYRTDIDPETGGSVRTPDIPAGWAFEQESSLLDINPGGQPVPAYRGNKRRALIRVAASMQDVDALVASYVGAGRANAISFSEYPADKAALRERMKTSRSRSLRKEFTQAVRENTHPIIDAVRRADAADEQARRKAELDAAAGTGTAPAWLLPLVGYLGIYGAARWLGIGVDDLLPFLALVATDSFTGSAGTDLDGRAWATGGISWDTRYTGKAEIATGGATGHRTSDTEIGYRQFTTDSFTDDQYAQVYNSTVGTFKSNDGPIVRGGYTNWQEWATRGYSYLGIYLYRDATQLSNSGTTNATGATRRIEAIGSAIEGFHNGSSDVAATDSTYPSGRPGMLWFDDGLWDDIEAGDIAAVQAATFPVLRPGGPLRVRSPLYYGRALDVDGVAAAGNVKTWNGLAFASIKTFKGLAVASVKTVNGVTTA